MTTHDEFEAQLSDYLDGELSDAEQRAVAAHVAGCAQCRISLRELEAVVRTASTLPAQPPASDLWMGIAARMEPRADQSTSITGLRRFSFSLPQLAAASVLLAVLSGWTATRLLSRPAPAQTVDVEPQPADDAPTAMQAADDARVVRASLDDTEYDAAVADLKSALEKGRGTLDPSTIAVLEDNLKTINGAVDEARRALAEDPANGYLSGYLVDTRRRQLDLLRHAAALANIAD